MAALPTIGGPQVDYLASQPDESATLRVQIAELIAASVKKERSADALIKELEIQRAEYRTERDESLATCRDLEAQIQHLKDVNEVLRSRVNLLQLQQNGRVEAEKELADLRGSITALREQVKEIAKEILEYWKEDRDARVADMLGALAGLMPGYRADIDAVLTGSAAPPESQG